MRRTIRKALPASEETISYGMPTYKMHGRAVIYFAGWKTHYSLYPIGKHIVAALEDDLARYEVDKSTVRFSLSKPVPVTLIAKIAKLRAQNLPRRRRASDVAQGLPPSLAHNLTQAKAEGPHRI